MWYYTSNGERFGPVSQFAIKSLYEQRAVNGDTLVWQEGLEGWQPLHSTRLARDLEVELPDGDSWEKCAFSGERCRRSEMVQIEGWWISNDCKDDAVELIKQGGRLPVVPLDSPHAGNVDLGHLLHSSWQLLAPCLPAAIGLYVLVWIPGNLLINYLDAFVLSEGQELRTLQVSNAVQSLWGNLATGGILFQLCQALRGRPVAFGDMVKAAFTHWGRLWVAGFISGIMTVIGLVLLIFPAFIVIVRTNFANSAAVDAPMSGSSAVQESWDITKGHFWRILGYSLLMGSICVSPMIMFGALSPLLPLLENWAVNAVVSTALELPLIYLLAFTLVFYRELKALSQARPRRQLNTATAN